jgi:hypothetical protein
MHLFVNIGVKLAWTKRGIGRGEALEKPDKVGYIHTCFYLHHFRALILSTFLIPILIPSTVWTTNIHLELPTTCEINIIRTRRRVSMRPHC